MKDRWGKGCLVPHTFLGKALEPRVGERGGRGPERRGKWDEKPWPWIWKEWSLIYVNLHGIWETLGLISSSVSNDRVPSQLPPSFPQPPFHHLDPLILKRARSCMEEVKKLHSLAREDSRALWPGKEVGRVFLSHLRTCHSDPHEAENYGQDRKFWKCDIKCLWDTVT